MVENTLKTYYDNVLNKPFSVKQFNHRGVFRTVGKVDDKQSFYDFKGLRCQDMPIKLPGGSYKIPDEYLQFKEVIQKMIDFETTYNNLIDEFYTYLTVDQSETLPGKTHRSVGTHVDGFQGQRVNPKVLCDRGYLVFDGDTPSFWNQPFPSVANLNVPTKEVFEEFDRVKEISAEIRCIPFIIYLMDCYTVHTPAPAVNPRRTFCRITFSVRKFDRPDNTANPLLTE